MDFPKPRPPTVPLSGRSLITPSQKGPLGLTSIPRKPSRCTQPREQPLTWIYYKGNDGDLIEEIRNVVDDLALPTDRELVLGLVSEKNELAASGDLADSDDIKPVSFDPEVWELRYEFNGLLYRLYFAEPYTHPHHLVALKFHVKTVDEAEQEIKDAQSAEMAAACIRFNAGEKNNWGSAA